MTAIQSHHSRQLKQLIAGWRETLLNDLALGNCDDYATYRQCVGRLQGLDDALRLSEEADFKLNGEDIDDS